MRKVEFPISVPIMKAKSIIHLIKLNEPKIEFYFNFVLFCIVLNACGGSYQLTNCSNKNYFGTAI